MQIIQYSIVRIHQDHGDVRKTRMFNEGVSNIKIY